MHCLSLRKGVEPCWQSLEKQPTDPDTDVTGSFVISDVTVDVMVDVTGSDCDERGIIDVNVDVDDGDGEGEVGEVELVVVGPEIKDF